jgi:hypothetical protein
MKLNFTSFLICLQLFVQNLVAQDNILTGVRTEFRISEKCFVSTALWGLFMQSELVYSGDAGAFETSNPAQRMGSEVGIHYLLTGKLFADVNFNYSHGRSLGVGEGKSCVRLAPSMTSIGGLTYKQEKGLGASLRYRCADSDPACLYSDPAKGYFLIDAVINYRWKRVEAGVTVENVMNVKWTEDEIDAEGGIEKESAPVSDLHFTPPTPLLVRANLFYIF